MRNKRYIWLPLVLFAYFLFMTFRFGIGMIHQGRILAFTLTCIAEVAVLVLLSISLRRRDRLRERRDDIKKG
ncbi:MAG: hypothetical protein K2O24_07500 [Muribaculaceae bacterium]|nr:hypothetical protein [Muribaculaceae bacterium]